MCGMMSDLRKRLEKTVRRGEGRLLFNDTWFQQGHSEGRGGGGRRREGGRERFGLYCLMTPGLSKDIQCHV